MLNVSYCQRQTLACNYATGRCIYATKAGLVLKNETGGGYSEVFFKYPGEICRI